MADALGQTQPVDGTFTANSQAEASASLDESVWGKLYSINAAFPSIDLKKEVTSFGRRADCDFDLSSINTYLCAPTAYSSVHFKIKREYSVKTGFHALLEDTSSNGTFINGEKVGKNRVQALKNNCEVSLAKKENRAYIFIDFSNNRKDEENLPADLKSKYSLTKELGKGAYGEVKLAFDKQTGLKYAVKIISKKKFTIHGKNQMNLTKQIRSEIEILQKLEHPCIIKIKEVFDAPDAVYIVLDLVEGGELFDKVVKIDHYDEKTAKLLFYQMVLAIKYLHDQGISHRDIKPENILLSSSEDNETLIKITDFGLSKFVDSVSMMKTFCGTPNYLAPEVLESRGEGSYTNKVDNWSLGVILYICLAGYPPFSEEDSNLSLDQLIKQGVYDFPRDHWSHVSTTAIDLIKRLMCIDPVKRASLDEVLEHEWIKNDIEMKEKAARLMYPFQTDTPSSSPVVVAANNKRDSNHAIGTDQLVDNSQSESPKRNKRAKV